MELIERIQQLERELKALRPELHFPSTATVEHRLRWLEIVLEEMRARDNHGVYAETPSEEKLRQLLAHTVYIKQDRITLHSLTADPGSVVAGDAWFRSDRGLAKLAIDTVVANAKIMAENTVVIGFIIDGSGSVIATGQKGHIEIPFTCTIQQVTMLADQSGSIVVDIWKDSYANFPPTDADSITASAPPTISSATNSQDSTLTGWTKTITAGDILAFNVDSCTTITRVTISLKTLKT